MSLKNIFSHLLKTREMHVNEMDASSTAEGKYRVWLHEIYNTTYIRLIVIMEQRDQSLQFLAFDTLMNLLTLEGKHPIETNNKSGSYYFPSHRLQQIIVALLSSTKSLKCLTSKFAEYSEYQDIVYYSWKILSTHIPTIAKPNELFIKNFLELVDKLTLAKDPSQELNVLCGSDEGPKFTMNRDLVCKWMSKTWRRVMKWDLTPATHKQLMVVLLEKILPHLREPLYLTDYFMEALGMGGAISVLALQGMLTLIQNYNLDYPNIYGKLYTMFEPEIFDMKYKPRLFHLADMFLTSSHLPQQMVAGFAKRLARLCMVAPPQDIHIMLAFIGNLLIRHPGLKKILVGSATDPVMTCDPYDMNETDPVKSRAIDSFLWEVYNLQRHYLPSVANAATQLVNSPLPSVEWDLGELLENTQDDIFEKELKKKTKEINLTYDKPQSLRLPQGEKLLQFWTLQ